ARLMAEILVENNELRRIKILDPSSGSGTLLMSIAHKIGVEKCSIYSQDISQKSSKLLQLNLLLNNLGHSMHNVVQGNTITHPVRGMKNDDKFDFIVSNPPFNLDFSDYRDSVADNPAYRERFFAGVPTIPNKKKESMSIYLLFIQHLLYALKSNGKGAIVVPTGFITAQSSIEKKIRQKLIENNWLKGVVSMPSNIFANTGTQVSVVFIDKSQAEQSPVLIDASKLGKQIKDGKNQRTLLSADDEQKIINAFYKTDEEDFSIRPSLDEIAAKNYSFAAGQYFDIKIEHIPISQDEFNQKMSDYKQELKQLFQHSQQLEQEIFKHLEKVFLNNEP
ncbi:MAG: N-6 DNA methylase, partial [Neisseriaceae bacterium]|nr:N-6 DNA methylase [Neisseriaceae bacterium]